MLIDAAGNEVESDRCGCGRHKPASSQFCCAYCAGDGRGRFHVTGCNLRQEHFRDTRRGVVATDHPSGFVVR